MTTRVITGTKDEIARQIAGLHGEVRQAVVYIEEPVGAPVPVPATVEEMFAEMQPYMSRVEQFDDSRRSIYERQEGE